MVKGKTVYLSQEQIDEIYLMSEERKARLEHQSKSCVPEHWEVEGIVRCKKIMEKMRALYISF